MSHTHTLSFDNYQRLRAAKFVAKKSSHFSRDQGLDLLKTTTNDTLFKNIEAYESGRFDHLIMHTTVAGFVITFSHDTYKDRDQNPVEIVWSVGYFVDPALGRGESEIIERVLHEPARPEKRTSNPHVVSGYG